MNRRTTARLLPRACVLIVAGAVLALGSAGCSEYRPRDYGRARPPIDRIDKRDRGLQSKDVVAASDTMAQDLLAIPEVAGSPERLLVVVDRVENRTQNARFDLDIFLERLRVKLAQLGRGQDPAHREPRQAPRPAVARAGGRRRARGRLRPDRHRRPPRPGGHPARLLALRPHQRAARPRHELLLRRVLPHRPAHAGAGVVERVRGEGGAVIRRWQVGRSGRSGRRDRMGAATRRLGSAALLLCLPAHCHLPPSAPRRPAAPPPCRPAPRRRSRATISSR